MSMNYLFESTHIVDYDLWSDPEIPFILRGPAPKATSNCPTISFIGAAQTFGAFVKAPFPTLLADMLSCQVLNLGRGGAGPGFYLRDETLINRINATSCVVIQVMSARSSMRNSAMESADELASVILKVGESKGKKVLGHHALKMMGAELSDRELATLHDETISNFMDQYKKLLEKIKVPKILLYVGRKAPLSVASTAEAKAARFKEPGLHPHLIDSAVVSTLGSMCSASVVLSEDLGSKKNIVNRFNGKHASIKRESGLLLSTHEAYISPYMHAKAAVDLFQPINSLLSK